MSAIDRPMIELPSNILFGTSSWTYLGWQGIVYHNDYKDAKDFNLHCLSEYCRFPLFRTVGIDSSFYAPPTREQLLSYAQQVPAEFQWVSKVWEEITIPVYPKHKRFGSRAGQININFLNPDIFCDKILSVYELAQVQPHLGAFIFEFQMMPLKTNSQIAKFIETLDLFFSRLPQTYNYSVEIRTPCLLAKPYFECLNRHHVAHCFNHWTYMPSLKEQMIAAANAGGLIADFQIARILTPLGKSYAQAVNDYQPYKSIKKELPQMREDVKTFAKRALKRNVKAFILVNNRSEGHAPGTIKALREMIIKESENNDQGEINDQ
ncbi:MAG: DUF72 domain-containing protein [Deltaproteobacteria bacterium]|nr:DUF72 domain-containing protein [Deltaproteobacteria bacterium]